MERAKRQEQRELWSLVDARAHAPSLRFDAETVPRPHFTGVRVFDDYPLEELVERIDWTPFFATWELAGRFPAILDDPVVGDAARKLEQDAQQMLARLLDEGGLRARAVFGFFPASGEGDRITLYGDETRAEAIACLPMLRQQLRAVGRACWSLADFVVPVDSGARDHLGLFTVSAG